ncbi:MAG: hypothetical protein EP329_28450, partial [Deltaproteobacteria bacterium]
MSRHRPASLSSLTACLVLAALLLGPLGLTPLARAAGVTSDACCETGCPCEDDTAAEAPGHNETDHDDADRGERSRRSCSPGCQGCPCCPGSLFAVPTPAGPPPGAPLVVALTRAGPERPVLGV